MPRDQLHPDRVCDDASCPHAQSHYALWGDNDAIQSTSATVAATARARLELEREKAEAKVRKQRVTNDAQLADAWGERTADIALRHRELDTWRELLGREGSIAPQPGTAHIRRTPSPQQDPDITPSADRLPSEPALGAADGSSAEGVERS